jgi:hypothetical protein
MFPSDEHLEDLRRYGMDPDPWGRDDDDAREEIRWAYLYTGPLHPSVADGSWGEAADDEDGEA